MAQAAEDGGGAVHEAGKDPGEVVTVGKAAEFRDLLDRAVAVMQQPAGAFDAEPRENCCGDSPHSWRNSRTKLSRFSPAIRASSALSGGSAGRSSMIFRARAIRGSDSGARRSAPGGSLSSAASSSDSAMNARAERCSRFRQQRPELLPALPPFAAKRDAVDARLRHAQPVRRIEVDVILAERRGGARREDQIARNDRDGFRRQLDPFGAAVEHAARNRDSSNTARTACTDSAAPTGKYSPDNAPGGSSIAETSCP